MKFVDLFAGIGGFHVALDKLGFECVFASEINEELRKLYTQNFGISCVGDIRNVENVNIPTHDILCAGFPCQSFSQAGTQSGLQDNRGNLFYEITRILAHHNPKYFILENVPNLVKHDNGETFKIIQQELKNLGYFLKSEVLSPHQFGIPQIRKRIFIVGSKDEEEINKFIFPKPIENNNINIRSVLDTDLDNIVKVEKRQLDCINTWQKIISAIPSTSKLPSFPIWTTEFGATYPFEKKATLKYSLSDLKKFKGAFGINLNVQNKEILKEKLPTYVVNNENEIFPKWKVRFIQQNRVFYREHKKLLKPFIEKLKTFPHSWQKFEWNCKGEIRDLKHHILQFRSSGLRVKRANYSPSLIASTMTQLPIIGWEMRYMTEIEAARLQSLEGIKLPSRRTAAFKSLGNAVNAKIVESICENFSL